MTCIATITAVFIGGSTGVSVDSLSSTSTNNSYNQSLHTEFFCTQSNCLFGWLSPDWLVIMIVFGFTIGFVCISGFNYAVTHIPPLVFSSIGLVDPLVTGLLSYIVGLEGIPDIGTWLGGIIVLIGVAIISQGEHGPQDNIKHSHESDENDDDDNNNSTKQTIELCQINTIGTNTHSNTILSKDEQKYDSLSTIAIHDSELNININNNNNNTNEDNEEPQVISSSIWQKLTQYISSSYLYMYTNSINKHKHTLLTAREEEDDEDIKGDSYRHEDNDSCIDTVTVMDSNQVRVTNSVNNNNNNGPLAEV